MGTILTPFGTFRFGGGNLPALACVQEAVECAIVSFDKASDARKIKRQQKLEVTKLDYELKAPSPMNTSICGKRFPSKFSTKKSVKKHLKRIIWVLSAQHSALNYPVDHLGTLTPNMPTKLYKDPRV